MATTLKEKLNQLNAIVERLANVQLQPQDQNPPVQEDKITKDKSIRVDVPDFSGT